MEIEKPNILLIILDTVRNDIIVNGITDGSLPNMATLSKEGVFSSKTISPSSWTVPSHASIFTGKYPSKHGVHESPKLKLLSEIQNKMGEYGDETLPEILRNSNYDTYGLVSNPQLYTGSGFERGFLKYEFFDMFADSENFRKKLRSKFEYNDKVILDESLDLLRNPNLISISKFVKKWKTKAISSIIRAYRYYNSFYKSYQNGYPFDKAGRKLVESVRIEEKQKPFFIFLNLMEAHEPYKMRVFEVFRRETKEIFYDLVGKKKLDKKWIQLNFNLYKKEIELLDNFIGEIMKDLKASNSYDDTLIVITSDHGQSFHEKNFYGHGQFLYDEMIRVPMLIKLPKSEKQSFASGYQSLVDLFKFLRAASKGLIDINLMTQEKVFSESFGAVVDYENLFSGEKDIIYKLREFDYAHTAMYRDEKKVVLDNRKRTLLEFNGYKRDELNSVITSNMIEELNQFIDSARQEYFEQSRTP